VAKVRSQGHITAEAFSTRRCRRVRFLVFINILHRATGTLFYSLLHIITVYFTFLHRLSDLTLVDIRVMHLMSYVLILFNCRRTLL